MNCNESQIIKCYECIIDKTVFELSPANIDDKLKLVCSDCWRSAVETGRAMIYTREELTTFSEFKTETDEENEDPEDVLDSKIIG